MLTIHIDMSKPKLKHNNYPECVRGPYSLFAQEQRPLVVKLHPDWTLSRVSQELGREWRSMTKDEKKVYEDVSYNDKLRYQKEMVEYIRMMNAGD